MRKNFINQKVNISNTNYYLKEHHYVIAKSPSLLTKKQIDSCISVIRFYIRKKKKKKKKSFINLIQYNIPITRKNKNSRMGAGKGKIKKFVAKISMNGILFIFKNIKKDTMLKIYKYIQYRLPIKVSLKSE